MLDMDSLDSVPTIPSNKHTVGFLYHVYRPFRSAEQPCSPARTGTVTPVLRDHCHETTCLERPDIPGLSLYMSM